MPSFLHVILFLFLHYNNPVSSLRLQANTSIFPLIFSIDSVFQHIFTDLIQQKKYDSVLNLLELKTFNTLAGYVEACASFSSQDYCDIIEYFYLMKKPDKLGLILSPDCLTMMNKSIFNSPLISQSLVDLPRSTLASDFLYSSFNFRTKSSSESFYYIITHALDNKFNDTNWDTIVQTPMSESNADKIVLSDVFAQHPITSHYEKTLFYYINPLMIPKCKYEQDVEWLLGCVLPISNRHPPLVVFKGTVMSPSALSSWNELLFRTVSSLSFYFHISDSINIMINNSWPQDKINVLNKMKIIVFESLTKLNSIVRKFLTENPKCKPFRNILNNLNYLHSIFIEAANFRIKDVSNCYEFIVWTFSNFSLRNVQGDWMYNLFYLFWNQKFMLLSKCTILSSISLFFSRSPTIYSIYKLNNLYCKVKREFHMVLSMPSFESEIPHDRLSEVYKKFPFIINSRTESIDFKFRYELALKWVRHSLGNDSLAYLNHIHYLSIPSQSTIIEESERSLQLIKVFESTIIALHNDTGVNPIRSYGKYRVTDGNLIKVADIRDCLKQFFDLILLIKYFHIVEKPHYSTNDPRPVIIISPLMSFKASNVLGQALAIASVLNVEIPFIISSSQTKVIFGTESCDEALNEQIFQYCDSDMHLNLLLLDQNSLMLQFSSAIRNYFENFHLPSVAVFERGVAREFVMNRFHEFNLQLSLGFLSIFSFSKFSYQEIITIIFKIKG